MREVIIQPLKASHNPIKQFTESLNFILDLSLQLLIRTDRFSLETTGGSLFLLSSDLVRH